MLVCLILPFLIFAVFDPSPLSVHRLQFFLHSFYYVRLYGVASVKVLPSIITRTYKYVCMKCCIGAAFFNLTFSVPRIGSSNVWPDRRPSAHIQSLYSMKRCCWYYDVENNQQFIYLFIHSFVHSLKWAASANRGEIDNAFWCPFTWSAIQRKTTISAIEYIAYSDSIFNISPTILVCIRQLCQ